MEDTNKLSLEKSENEATKLGLLQNLVRSLDIDYLKQAYADMRNHHVRKDSMAILNPNPFSHAEKQALEALKLKQLDLYIQLSENLDFIIEAQANVQYANQNADKLSKLFM